MIVKKYGNRRLYDTEESRYITIEELAAKVRAGSEVTVQDAKSGEDLTQSTLVQIILDSRGAGRMLPVPLLVQLIRMGDTALSEFLGRYVSAALELYLQARQGAQTIAPYNPFATMPFSAGNAIARMFGGAAGWSEPQQQPPRPPPQVQRDELAELRREMDELKRGLRKPVRAKKRR